MPIPFEAPTFCFLFCLISPQGEYFITTPSPISLQLSKPQPLKLRVSFLLFIFISPCANCNQVRFFLAF
jgi:hypothetical protein